MGRGYGPLVAMYTVVSVFGLAWRINFALQKAIPDGVLSVEKAVGQAEAVSLLQSLCQSSLTMALLANLVVNFFILVALFIKALFFGRLSLMETQKVVERLINFVLFKGLFLAWVVQPEIIQIALWLTWFCVLGFLKMFQGLARDRLDRLNASPTATLMSHARVYSVLVLVLLSDLFWIQLCILIFKDIGTSTFLLLLFEPLSIAIETLQAVVVHGMQLLDTWQRNTIEISSQCSGLQPLDRSAAGAAWEWRGTVVRNCSFIMDLVSLLLALGHCLHIWWLRGLAFQVVDGILFLNLRALLSAILKRIKGFMRLRTAMNILQGALPDATEEELLTYDDDCAICKEPMARAKRLPCAHLFHLPCLRSWLDQGLAETYSCPTCRRPLFMGSARMAASSLQAGHQIVDGDQIGRTINGAADRGSNDQQLLGNVFQQASQNPLMGPFLSQRWNATTNNDWRALPVGSMEGGGPSTESGTGGLGHMQVVMRHIAGGGGRSSPQHQSAEGGWRWWPFARHNGERDSMPAGVTGRQRLDTSFPHGPNSETGLSSGVVPDPLNLRDTRMGSMVSMVREVLPHIPDEVIIQDLQRTNSATATVNNLL